MPLSMCGFRFLALAQKYCGICPSYFWTVPKLGLLKELYGTVIIPNAVKDEIEAKSKSKAQGQLEASVEWIHVENDKNCGANRRGKHMILFKLNFLDFIGSL